MRILGIDYGTKRVGLAISDESETLARELTILSLKQFWEEIAGIVESSEVLKIVVGWPLGMSGEMTMKTQEVEKFILKLEKKIPVRVVKFDERLSSQMAMKMPGGMSKVDSLAAQIILQNYLDTQKK